MVDAHETLRREVTAKMPGQSATMVDIVTAVTGLLASVAYSDRTITAEESRHLEASLGRINGFSKEGASAIAQVLHQHALRLSTSFVQRFTRVLREELAEDERREVLDILLSMAAADGSITFDETKSLRNMTTGLGLSQQHYNELQAKYKGKLKLG